MLTARQQMYTIVQIIVCLGSACLAGAASAAEAVNSENRLQIMDALAQYSYRWDGKDSVGFANLFTDDAVIERQLEGKLVEGSRLQGKAAILDYAQRSHQGRLADRQTRHHFSAIVFLELSNEHAVTENMALITHQTADSNAPFIRSSGIYRISWRNTPQGWQMTHRTLFSDSFQGQ
jgi:hypothetical protein